MRFSDPLKLYELAREIVTLSKEILLEKPGPHKTACLILDLLFGTVFQKFRKKLKNLNTFKYKMKHYYRNDLSNPNL